MTHDDSGCCRAILGTLRSRVLYKTAVCMQASVQPSSMAIMKYSLGHDVTPFIGIALMGHLS